MDTEKSGGRDKIMARNRKRGKLFYKFLIIFLMVSLIPLAIVGYYLVNLSKITLNKAISTDQESLAIGFADTVANSIISYRNILVEAARIDNSLELSGEKFKTKLSNLMQAHAAFLGISFINSEGRERVRIERFLPNSNLRDFTDDLIFKRTMKTGEFIGGLERYMGSYPSLIISLAIIDPQTHQGAGVLMTRLSLNGLSGILKTSFPNTTHTRAAVIDSSGFLVAHSDTNELFKPDAKLPDDVLEVLLRNDAKSGGGEIRLSTGERVLGAFAEVPELGWVVYIQRPVSLAYQASNKMLRRTYRMILIVMVFVLFLGYAVSLVITQPIEALREAALKLGEGDFDYLPELSMPNDEIGELAHTFIQMSEALKIKTAEIISSKEEVERLNRSLENRVEARTRELKSAQDELIKKERLAAIGQMSSVVGHEIRNPLAVINNSVYFMKTKLSRSEELDPKIKKHLGIIESEIKQANSIINEILGFARTREMKPELTRVNDYLEELASTYPFPEHVEVVKQFAPENPPVKIDKDEMTQAIRNLVRNAIEVMPEKGRLILRSEVVDNFVRMDVEDTGPGIPPDVLNKIFAPFFTTKARGTGLGLAVVKKVVDRHKGKVDAVSQIGKGTCFKLCIPIIRDKQ